ncbi:MAG: TolC family protein [Flavobacteriales bacterium]|nr:TolC family protein [Flavobacteriales bacterium]
MKQIAAFLLCVVAGSISAQDLLTADQALNLALEHNHGVRLARLTVKSAELMNTAGEAGMLPTIDAVGMYDGDRSATRQTFFSGEVREVDDANSRVLSGAVQLNWTVFDGLTMFATKDRLATVEAIERSLLKQRLESTVYEVLATYYQAVQMGTAIEVQRTALRSGRERLQIAETGERIGSTSGLQVVQARMDLSADSAALLDLHAQRTMALHRLNLLLGRDPSIAFTVEKQIPAAEALDLTELQSDAQRANSSITEARQQQLAADFAVKELRGALFPRVDVFGNYAYRRSQSDVGFLQSNRAIGPDYGVRLSVPIFRGGQATRATEVAKLGSEQAAIATEGTRLLVEQQLLDDWTQYRTAITRVALEQNNLQGTQQQVNVALESYRLGVITAVELRDVQQSLIDAENRLLLAQYEAKLAELRLKWLAGRLV